MPTDPNRLRPVADLNTTVWVGDDGSTSSLFSRLADESPSTYVTSNALRSVGVVTFVTFTDDEKQEDGRGTFIDGFRTGEVVVKDILDLEARATFIPNYWCTRGLCMPSRTELVTSLTRMNHGCENGADYRTNYWQIGKRVPRDIGGSNQYQGPFYTDLALQAGLDETPVDPLVQPLATTVNSARAVPVYASATTYAQYAIVSNGSGQNYISQQANNHANALTNTAWWLPTTALIGRGDPDPAVDDLQYCTGNIFTRLPDEMTARDILAGRAVIKKAWIGKGDTYNGSTESASPYNVEDPEYAEWDAGTTYALNAGVHDGYFFYTSKAAGNIGHRPTLGVTDANWTCTQPPRTTRMIPAGIHFFAVLMGDGIGDTGDPVDYYHNEYQVYDAATANYTNPRDGNGVVGDRYAFDYDQPITSISWDAGSSRALVTLTNALGYKLNQSFVAEDLVVGDEVAIQYCTGGSTAYNSRGWIVDEVVSNTQFYVRVDAAGAPVTNGGTWSTTGAVAFPRKYYTAQLDKRWLNRFLDTITIYEHAFIYYCPRMPHAETADTGGTEDQNPAFELERRYFETVDATEALMYGNVPGAYSPANLSGPTSANQRTWRCRQELLGSWNDIMCRDNDAIVPRLDARYGTRWKWIRFSDNGWQQGAHEATEGSDVWSRVDGKDMVWSESCNVPLFIIDEDNPHLTPGATLWGVGPFIPADIGPTIMDIFAVVDPPLTTHHVHTKSDGQSIYRWLDASDTDDIRNRLVPCQGKFLENIWGGTAPTSTHGGLAVMDKRNIKMYCRFDDADGSGGGWKRFDETIPDYASGTTFSQWQLCKSGNDVYISLQNGNTGHTPSSSPTWWQLAPSLASQPELTDLKSGSAGAWDDTTNDMAAALFSLFGSASGAQLGAFDGGRWNGTTNTMRAAYTGA